MKKLFNLAEMITVVLVLFSVTTLAFFAIYNQEESNSNAQNELVIESSQISSTVNSGKDVTIVVAETLESSSESLFESVTETTVESTAQVIDVETTKSTTTISATKTSTSAARTVRVDETSQSETSRPVNIETTTSTTTQTTKAIKNETSVVALSDFLRRGVIYFNDYKFTYYSQSKLPGHNLKIPGRHVNKDGYVSDGDGYIVLANNAPIGTIFDTPFGYQGKVYDRGFFGDNHIDVYVR